MLQTTPSQLISQRMLQVQHHGFLLVACLRLSSKSSFVI